MVNPNTKPLIIPLSSQQIILFFLISKQLQYDKFCCTFNECIHKCIRCSKGHPQNSQTTDLLRTNFFSTKGNTLTAVLTTRANQVRLDHDKV